MLVVVVTETEIKPREKNRESCQRVSVGHHFSSRRWNFRHFLSSTPPPSFKHLNDMRAFFFTLVVSVLDLTNFIYQFFGNYITDKLLSGLIIDHIPGTFLCII